MDALPFRDPASSPASNSAESVRHRLTANASQTGQRADRVLAEAIGTLSRSRVKSLIESGCLSCDGQIRTDPALALRAGMELVLEVPPAAPARPLPENIPLTILYEDRDLLVLDKPPGLVVHPAPGNETGTLVNALLAHCGPEFEGIGGEKRPGIVHRLDKDTSGVMVVAKTPLAHQALSDAFATRDIERAYQALAWGVLPPQGEFDGAIGRDKRDRKRMTVVSKGGKHALTRFKTLETFHDSASLVECRLATGRTHQIRVHLSQAGHPLMGDPVYLRRIPGAARGLPREGREAALDFPRQALHAATLGFKHPRTGEMLRFSSPLPEDFRILMEKLKEK
ncbi:RluA family pseudouridine synthase [Oecophyllibacter saccharovorans]|uniref:RluA family pseudouridine synthase n=1 Tax=Oecophyllibacter saccharovorans TaxID=2558360 RepID=UPI00116A13E6|nr:RluA family pseudouridine synthase [Oecophyllibacter saccharovorans]TPW36823.1 RluA family pseudouridine synthase [Oecophyllibacter saccharovorans]